MYIYVPNAPSVSTSVVSWNQINLTITQPASNGGRPITSYNIYINGSLAGSTAYTESTTTYQAASLSAYTQYIFVVTAVNSIGEGYQSAQTTPITTPATFPNAPTITAALINPTQIDITITPPTFSGGGPLTFSYKIYMNDVYTTTITNTTYSANNLTAGQTYTFTVSAVNTFGLEGNKSGPQTITATVPSAPSITTKVNSSSQVTISITAGSNGGLAIDTYYIYQNGNYIGSTTSNTYLATGLSVYTNYNFAVSAHNSLGEGAKSSLSYATTYNLYLYTSPGTFTVPGGITQINISIQGGGQGGFGSKIDFGCGGTGNGAAGKFIYPNIAASGGNIVYINQVGAGGAGGNRQSDTGGHNVVCISASLGTPSIVYFTGNNATYNSDNGGGNVLYWNSVAYGYGGTVGGIKGGIGTYGGPGAVLIEIFS